MPAINAMAHMLSPGLARISKCVRLSFWRVSSTVPPGNQEHGFRHFVLGHQGLAGIVCLGEKVFREQAPFIWRQPANRSNSAITSASVGQETGGSGAMPSIPRPIPA